MDELQDGVLAGTTVLSTASRVRTIERALHAWGLDPHPPTMDSLRALGASLKRGGYRSASLYLRTYKAEAQREGYPWSDVLERALRDAIRSCERGLGPPTRAQPLPFHLLHELPSGREPWVVGGPCNPRNAITVGACWLLREVELGTARAAHASWEPVGWHGRAAASLTLPASKTDQLALGASRAHRCWCGAHASPACPAHALGDQLLWLAREHGDRLRDPVEVLSLPLFPDALGGVVEKQAMVATILVAARLLRVEPPADGSERVSGHSLRSTGAQGLIRAGWSPQAVRLMGRWESETVARYTRLAPLEYPMAALPFAPVDLEAELVERCGARRPAAREALPDGASVALPEGVEVVGTELCWVMNITSGVHHLALRRRPRGSRPRTLCGWRYADAPHAAEAPPPSFFWVVCSSCAPATRAVLKGTA